MLRKLSIQNFALIDQIDLGFKEGLNIITGETGAGKSILLGALSLILGQRADSLSFPDSGKKCIVEGTFSFSDRNKNIQHFFKEYDLDQDDLIILRREINPEGKSRAFINDTPVNLAQLRELGSLLIDIHSQHQTLLLNRADFQLSTIDAFAGCMDLTARYSVEYNEYLNLGKKLREYIEAESKSKSDKDYLEYQLEEFEKTDLKPGEQEDLEMELQTLTHAGEISTAIASVELLLSSGEENILQSVRQVSGQLSQLATLNKNLKEVSERMKSVEIELRDLSDEIESKGGDIRIDPERTEIVTERLNQIYRLHQKHRTKNLEELLEIRNNFLQRLSDISTLSEQIESTNGLLNAKKSELNQLAAELSGKRNMSIPKFEKEISSQLKNLGMPNAVLKIENDQLTDNEIGPDGIDRIQFLFSANKGVAYSEIQKVASGGELSRVMLCIKSSIAKLVQLPTLILDEIDTGVSGEVAFQIGQLMEGMSESHQLLVITHLPQIAGRGGAHFYVYKEINKGKTYTRVKLLSKEERVMEVARMLSGDKPTAIAMKNAKELMKT